MPEPKKSNYRRLLTTIVHDMPERFRAEFAPSLVQALEVGAFWRLPETWETVEALLDKRVAQGMDEGFLVVALFNALDSTLAIDADPKHHEQGKADCLVEIEKYRSKHGDRSVEEARTNQDSRLYYALKYVDNYPQRLLEQQALYKQWCEHKMVAELRSLRQYNGHWFDLKFVENEETESTQTDK